MSVCQRRIAGSVWALEGGLHGHLEWNIQKNQSGWSPGLGEQCRSWRPGPFCGHFPEAYLDRRAPRDREKNIFTRSISARRGRRESPVYYRRILADRSIHCVEVRGQLVPDPGASPWRMSSFYRHYGAKRSDQTAQFLAEASATLSTLVDYQSTCQSWPNLASLLADWCISHMVNDGARGACRGAPDPSKVELAATGVGAILRKRTLLRRAQGVSHRSFELMITPEEFLAQIAWDERAPPL